MKKDKYKWIDSVPNLSDERIELYITDTNVLTNLNERLGATILMVTHDAFTASYADRIIFIKDGKIFNEITKGNDTRKQFFEKIIEVQTLLGGELNDVI